MFCIFTFIQRRALRTIDPGYTHTHSLLYLLLLLLILASCILRVCACVCGGGVILLLVASSRIDRIFALPLFSCLPYFLFTTVHTIPAAKNKWRLCASSNICSSSGSGALYVYGLSSSRVSGRADLSVPLQTDRERSNIQMPT